MYCSESQSARYDAKSEVSREVFRHSRADGDGRDADGEPHFLLRRRAFRSACCSHTEQQPPKGFHRRNTPSHAKSDAIV